MERVLNDVSCLDWQVNQNDVYTFEKPIPSLVADGLSFRSQLCCSSCVENSGVILFSFGGEKACVLKQTVSFQLCCTQSNFYDAPENPIYVIRGSEWALDLELICFTCSGDLRVTLLLTSLFCGRNSCCQHLLGYFFWVLRLSCVSVFIGLGLSSSRLARNPYGCLCLSHQKPDDYLGFWG